MCRILILDDDQRFAESLKPIVEDFDENAASTVDIVISSDESLKYAKAAVLSGHPYTIFLVDQRLGPGQDGIGVMKDLLNISPESSAIIFTGMDDPSIGIRAYAAGAFRYLVKPIEPQELTFVLTSLIRYRREGMENRWRKILSEMVEAALHRSQFVDVAEVIANFCLHLGFERAHLFWIPKRDALRTNKAVVGVISAGVGCVPAFNQKSFRLDNFSFIKKVSATHDVVFVNEQSLNEGIFEEMEKIGFVAPMAGLWILPLWSGEEVLGVIIADFWKTARYFGSYERDFLNLFARQASVTLEHASLFNKEKRTSRETEIISYIGRQVSTRAATQDLTKLLEQIREQVGLQFDVPNFAIFLYDDQSNTINFELEYKDGVLQEKNSRSGGNGLEEYMLVQTATSLNIPDVEEFLFSHGLKPYGKIPHHWLGSPLVEGDKIVGGICICEYRREKEFSDQDKRFLSAVADQAAGAIQISNFKKYEDEDKRQIQLLHRASTELLIISRKSEQDFWFTALTVATANFGLGFNRALLFFTKDNSHTLYGRAGAGRLDVNEGLRNLEKDIERKYSFSAFLSELEEGKAQKTPFNEIVLGIELTREEFAGDIYHAIQAGKLLMFTSGDTDRCPLPKSLIQLFQLSTFALVPIWINSHAFGFVVVDSAYTQRSLGPKALDNLQTLLTNAGLIAETIRLRAKSDDLLDANFEILGGAGHQTLGETLSRICKTARTITMADWAVIHSLRKNINPNDPHDPAFLPTTEDYDIDLDNIGSDGNLKFPIMNYSTNKPHLGGISQHVLREGIFLVDNVDTFNKDNPHLNVADHHFIKEEGVKALIGVAVNDPYSNEILGIFYLDYREVHSPFSDLEIHHAKALGSLASVAISNHRRLEEHRTRMLADYEISEAVGPTMKLDQLFPQVLMRLQTLFKDISLCILLFNEDDESLYFAPGTSKFYEIENSDYKNIKSYPLAIGEKRTIASRVARQALLTGRQESEYISDVSSDVDYAPLNPRTTSELAVSLMRGDGTLLGVLVLERADYHFNEEDVILVKTAASQLSVAITRAEQNEDMNFYSTVSTLTAWASEVAHDIINEVGNILSLTYLIREHSNHDKRLQQYAEKIDESVKLLSSVGPWAVDNRESFVLDEALKRFLRPLGLQRDIQIITLLNAPDVHILANPSDLQRILRHLVKNADKVMALQPEKTIEVRTKLCGGGFVEILFRDFGPGIQDEEIRETIFRRRVEKDTDGGYGLLLVRQLVESMGFQNFRGSIRLLPHDPTAPGAIFSIKLPMYDHAQDVE